MRYHFLLAVLPLAVSAAEFSQTDRSLVFKAELEGKASVPVIFVTKPGEAGTLGLALQSLGCASLRIDTAVDYVRADVPLPALATAAGRSEVRGLALADLDPHTVLQGLDEPPAADAAPPAKSETPAPAVPAGAATPDIAHLPLRNPYTGINAMQAITLRDKNVNFDGRGATVQLVGDELHPAIPELQRALSLDGKPLAKESRVYLSQYRLFNPDDSEYDYRERFPTEAIVVVGSGVGLIHGRRYQLPDGVAMNDLRGLEYTRHDPLTRSITKEQRAAREKMDHRHGIVWDTKTGRIWVDVSQKLDFRDDTPIAAYSIGHQTVLLGDSDPATNADNRVSLVVEPDPATRDVYLRDAFGGHGGMVAGTIAATGLMGGAATGLAPAARVIGDSSTNPFLFQFTEAIMEARRPDVDILSCSEGNHFQVDDGAHPMSVLAGNILRESGKVMVMAAGNYGPVMTNRGSLDEVIGVGAYTPPETWKANFGLVPTDDVAVAYSSPGPNQGGDFVAHVLGVTGTLTTFPPDRDGENRSGWYNLPAGYFVGGGTSQATPSVAGIFALLVSAAKQENLPHDPDRLKAAVFSTCRFLPGVEARIQGNGVPQVADALDALKKLKDHPPVRIEKDGPVRTVLSDRLQTPGRGKGLFEREGWTIGMTGTRTIGLKRVSGPKEPVRCKLRWKEASEVRVFSSKLTEVTLPLNERVEVRVDIHPTGTGSFSAVLDVVDPADDLITGQMLCTVVVPADLNAGDQYTATVSGWTPRPGGKSVFVRVPAGASVLRVHADVKAGEFATLLAVTPSDHEKGGIKLAGGGDFLIENPEAGTWELGIKNDGMADGEKTGQKQDWRLASGWSAEGPRCEFTLSCTAYGVKSDGEGAGLSNLLAPVTAKPVGSGVGHRRILETTLQPGLSPLYYEIEIPKGATRLTARVAKLVRGNSDVDLYLYRLSEKRGAKVASLSGYRYATTADKMLELPEGPGTLEPGRYVLAVDPYNVPFEGVKVRIETTIFDPAYGTVTVDPVPTDLKASGVTLNANPKVELKEPLANGETAIASVEIVSDDVAQTKDWRGKAMQEKVYFPLGRREFGDSLGSSKPNGAEF